MHRTIGLTEYERLANSVFILGIVSSGSAVARV